jgi:hypothetical protein
MVNVILNRFIYFEWFLCFEWILYISFYFIILYYWILRIFFNKIKILFSFIFVYFFIICPTFFFKKKYPKGKPLIRLWDETTSVSFAVLQSSGGKGVWCVCVCGRGGGRRERKSLDLRS